jgi:hypothetical protein
MVFPVGAKADYTEIRSRPEGGAERKKALFAMSVDRVGKAWRNRTMISRLKGGQ